MKTTLFSSPGPASLPRHDGMGACQLATRRSAFSLIEMIGVMAVIAVAAAMLMPILVQQADVAIAGQEVTTMQSFATALQNNIQRNRAIPTTTNWIAVVANELGMNTNSVAFTVRNQPRILLIDTNGFGSLPLPYAQTSSGTPNPVGNSTPPRFMIVSSLGQALPSLTGTNGYPKSVDFNALWTAPAGTVPANTGSPWIGWKGKATDVSIQRVDLAYLFAHLVLSNSDATNAQYSIDGFNVVNLAPNAQLNAWYLTSTVLSLYMASTNLEASQVLLRDSSWVFSGGGWRSTPAPAVSTNLVSNILVDNDVGNCCRQLNCQIFNTNTCNPWTTTFPTTFCNHMSNCMSLYQQYAASGFSNHTIRNNLQTCCSQINNNDVPGLCANHH